MLALGLLSLASVALAAPDILLSQLQRVGGGRCLDNTRGVMEEGNPIQWWDCAGTDAGSPFDNGPHHLANPNQGFRSEKTKWVYVHNPAYCLGLSTSNTLVLARCQGHGPDVLSVDWGFNRDVGVSGGPTDGTVLPGSVGNLCSGPNYIYCVADTAERNGDSVFADDRMPNYNRFKYNYIAIGE